MQLKLGMKKSHASGIRGQEETKVDSLAKAVGQDGV